MHKQFTIVVGTALAMLALLACGMPSLALVEPSPTPRPSRTARPTFTPTPTETPQPTPTPTRTATTAPPTATITHTPLPTDTPPPTNTPPPPTNTPRPRPTNTPAPPPPPPPPPPSPYEFSGSLGSLEQSYNCRITSAFIAVRVIDRNGKPLKGYVAHIGKDGDWSKWAAPSTDVLKDADKAYAYNADFGVAFGVKYYVSLFAQEMENFNVGQALSGPKEVEVYFPLKDEDDCETSGRTKGIRVAPVIFTFNR